MAPGRPVRSMLPPITAPDAPPVMHGGYDFALRVDDENHPAGLVHQLRGCALADQFGLPPLAQSERAATVAGVQFPIVVLPDHAQNRVRDAPPFKTSRRMPAQPRKRRAVMELVLSGHLACPMSVFLDRLGTARADELPSS